MSIGPTLAKQAINYGKLTLSEQAHHNARRLGAPLVFVRQVYTHAPYLASTSRYKSILPSNFMQMPAPQVPGEVAKSLRESKLILSLFWAFKNLSWTKKSRQVYTEIHKTFQQYLNFSPDVAYRINHAIKPEAPAMVEKYLQDTCKPELEALTKLDKKIATGWWPTFTYNSQLKALFRKGAEKIVLSETNREKLEAVLNNLVEKPKEIEKKVLKDLEANRETALRELEMMEQKEKIDAEKNAKIATKK